MSSPMTLRNFGGIYQLVIESADDLAKIDTIDAAKWSATSAPLKDLHVDPALLGFLDTDQNGRIRVAGVLSARDWLFARLAERAGVTARSDELTLAHLDLKHADGEKLLHGAEHVLRELNLGERKTLKLAEVRTFRAGYSKTLRNGDGVVPAELVTDAGVAEFVKAVMGVVGSLPDASGFVGVGAAQLARYLEGGRAYLSWKSASKTDPGVLPLGDKTEGAWAQVQALDAKIDEQFLRCEFMKQEGLKGAALKLTDEEIRALRLKDAKGIEAYLEASPLDEPDASCKIAIGGKVNPAFQEKWTALGEVLALVLPGQTQLDRAGWRAVRAALAPYAAWMAQKPPEPFEKIGDAALEAQLGGPLPEKLQALIQSDAAAAAEVSQIAALEKLILFQRWLIELGNNFVNFSSIYNPEKTAMIEMGAFVVDGRRLEFCIKVDTAARAAHKKVAADSLAFLVYAQVTESDGKSADFEDLRAGHLRRARAPSHRQARHLHRRRRARVGRDHRRDRREPDQHPRGDGRALPPLAEVHRRADREDGRRAGERQRSLDAEPGRVGRHRSERGRHRRGSRAAARAAPGPRQGQRRRDAEPPHRRLDRLRRHRLYARLRHLGDQQHRSPQAALLGARRGGGNRGHQRLPRRAQAAPPRHEHAPRGQRLGGQRRDEGHPPRRHHLHPQARLPQGHQGGALRRALDAGRGGRAGPRAAQQPDPLLLPLRVVGERGRGPLLVRPPARLVGAGALEGSLPDDQRPLRASPVPPLSPGAAVSIVAPSSPFERARFERGLTALRSLSLLPTFSDGLFSRWPADPGSADSAYLAGDDARRLAELRAALRDPASRLIVLARGGYGSMRIAAQLSPEEIAGAGKLLLGYSDATVLHQLWARAGLPSIHGPMCTQLGEEPDALARLGDLLSGRPAPPIAWSSKQFPGAPGGAARGVLQGGNLATLAALCGSPLQPRFEGNLVLLEDLNEPPYRLDRLCTQLLQSGAFSGAAGFVIGDLWSSNESSNGRAEVLAERLGSSGVPLAFGAPFGHAGRNQPVAFGCLHELDASAGTLTPLESPTRAAENS